MHVMEESVRSGGVVKKKSSSGCLIIKKKSDALGSVVGSSHQEKKRARSAVSDSGSSGDSLEPVRRKVNENIRNGPIVYGRRAEQERELRRNGDIIDRERERERKRSRLDLFDFDEYDEFDGKRTRDDYPEMVSGRSREFGGGSGRNMVAEKRKHSYFDGSSGGVSGRNKVVNYGGKSRHDLDEDEAHLPISLLRLKYQDDSAEPIRLQGKNGVLKVMVNKKKNVELSSRKNYDRQEFESRKGSRSEDVIKKEPSVPTPFYSDSRKAEKRIAFAEREKSQLKLQKPLLGKSNKAGDFTGEKSETKIQKPLPGKSIKAEDCDSDGADTALKLAPPSLEAGSSRKTVKREAKRSLTPENLSPVKSGERKVIAAAENVTTLKGVEGKLKQRGGSTEKQLLRERIREMLMKAGWTIDYRPRRNRDYLDAVYINPSGTAYWSIIKAYDALQKQLQEKDDKGKPDGVSSSFAPLSDDLINKLTRQTRKKIEEEMKRNRRNDGLTKNSKKVSVKESTDDADSDQNDERLSSFIKQNGKPKKGRLHELKCMRGDDLSDDTHRQNSEQERAHNPSTTSSSVVQGRKSRKIGRCTLLIRISEKGQNSESDGYVPYTGKRTLLAWLIDSGTVQLSEKVQYMNRRRTRVKLEGWITKDGIHCGCCSKILTVSKFELHAGSKLRQPFQNIILETGSSLLQCLIDAWNKQEESVRRDFYLVDVDGDDPDDDTCGICGDGGDLICCDGCPSTFHQNCLGIQMPPPGDWHCPNCTCKFCGAASGSPSNENSATSSELFMCTLCEKKYHKSCDDGMVAPLANGNNPSISFCGKKCQELYDQLQKILGVKHELEAGFSWSLIQRTDLESDTASRGFPQRVESNSKLAVALSVMDECFLPIIDRRSEINLIHNVLYNCGSNFSRLNFRGFFTMILERGDEIISAASIRIHGQQLAEMPFIGTRNIYRRQGMCRRLLSAIESVLCSLKVERLIIPAISEHMHTWTVVFGFKQLQHSDKKEMKSMNMLVFPGTDMLQKQLLKQEIPDGITSSGSKDNLLQAPASIEKPEIEVPTMLEAKTPSNVGSDDKNTVVDKADTVIVSSASATLLNDRTVDEATGTAHESVIQLSRENACMESQLVKDSGESSSSDGVASKPSDIENSILDPLAKCDAPCSADNLLSDAYKMNIAVSPSDSILGFSDKTSENMVEDADENQNTVFAADCNTDKISMQNLKDQAATVVEMQKTLHTSAEVVPNQAVRRDSDGAVPEDVVNSGIKVTTSQNGIEKVHSDTPHCCNGDPIIQFNSELNELAAINAESGSHVPSATLGDTKAAGDLKIDSGDPKKGISVVTSVNNDAGTDVQACQSESAPDFIDEASSQNGLDDFRKQKDASSNIASQCTDAEVIAVGISLSYQDKSEIEIGLSVASRSDSGAEISLMNKEEVHSTSKSENICEENAEGNCSESRLDSSATESPQRAVEEIQGTFDGNSESSGQLSPELNKTTALVLDAGILEGSESTASETVVETEGTNKLHESQKAETVLDCADLAPGSSCVSLEQDRTACDQGERT